MPHYEAWFDDTNAAHTRFSRALIATDTKLVGSYKLGETVVVILRFKNANKIDEFTKQAKLKEQPKYRPPTVFDNGTLRPIYASPEDEVNNRPTESAKRLLGTYNICNACGAII